LVFTRNKLKELKNDEIKEKSMTVGVRNSEFKDYITIIMCI